MTVKFLEVSEGEIIPKSLFSDSEIDTIILYNSELESIKIFKIIDQTVTDRKIVNAITFEEDVVPTKMWEITMYYRGVCNKHELAIEYVV